MPDKVNGEISEVLIEFKDLRGKVLQKMQIQVWTDRLT
jgi:hypothetical protein